MIKMGKEIVKGLCVGVALYGLFSMGMDIYGIAKEKLFPEESVAYDMYFTFPEYDRNLMLVTLNRDTTPLLSAEVTNLESNHPYVSDVWQDEERFSEFTDGDLAIKVSRARLGNPH